jgi:hypothetical protein
MELSCSLLILIDKLEEEKKLYEAKKDEDVKRTLEATLGNLKNLFQSRKNQVQNLSIKEKLVKILTDEFDLNDVIDDSIHRTFSNMNNFKVENVVKDWLNKLYKLDKGYELHSIAFANSRHRKNLDWKDHLNTSSKSFVNINDAIKVNEITVELVSALEQLGLILKLHHQDYWSRGTDIDIYKFVVKEGRIEMVKQYDWHDNPKGDTETLELISFHFKSIRAGRMGRSD